MPISINTNIAALNAQREANKTTNSIRTSFERLSSGRQINKASDNPAGLAIALDLLVSADTGTVAARNISDGVSALSIADGALESASTITTRLSELATQASNETLSNEQRQALNNEFQALRSELDRIASTTEFNGQSLLSSDSTLDIQAGVSGGSDSRVSVSLPGVSAASLGLSADLSTAESARTALDQSKAAGASIASSRAEIGAGESRLASSFENLKTSELNQRAAASQILDADVARESSELNRNNIRQQASVAIAAQANIQPSVALKLLS